MFLYDIPVTSQTIWLSPVTSPAIWLIDQQLVQSYDKAISVPKSSIRGGFPHKGDWLINSLFSLTTKQYQSQRAVLGVDSLTKGP